VCTMGGMILSGEKGSTKKVSCSVSTLLATNPTWSGLDLNLCKKEFMCYKYSYERWDG
jgi:hypothetical protein